MSKHTVLDTNQWTLEALDAIETATADATNRNHPQITPEHLLAALTIDRDSVVAAVLDTAGISRHDLRNRLHLLLTKLPSPSSMTDEPKIGPDLHAVIQRADEERTALADDNVSSEHLLLAMAERLDLDHRTLLDALEQVRDTQGDSRSIIKNSAQAIERYGRDLTEHARLGRLDPVIRRDSEIRRCIQILARRTKNNPVLVGEPGVGKTAIVEGLAQRIVEGRVPDAIANTRLVQLDMSAIVGDARLHGDVEQRVTTVLQAITQADRDVIIFIDQFDTTSTADRPGKSTDLGNLIARLLERGELHLIATTTPDNSLIDKGSAPDRRVQSIDVDPPSAADTVAILRALRQRYEAHHGITIEDDALLAAASLSDRYITAPQLPAKAIDLIDDAASERRIDIATAHTSAEMSTTETAHEKVGAEDIAQVVSRRTAISVDRLLEDEMHKLQRMDTALRERVIGQHAAVDAVTNAIRRSRTGIAAPDKPIGSFLFIGPTGVGKTELARALAGFMFDDERAMIRIDMSNHIDKHAVSRLFGAPPRHIGSEESGQLTEAIRRRPRTVVLLDDIDKAHPDVFNVLLKVLDSGRLTDGRGRTVDFRNTVLTMTSDLRCDPADVFPVDFVNRLDDIVRFRSLDEADLLAIVDIQLARLAKRLETRRLTLDVTLEATTWLTKAGLDPDNGAQPLESTIQREIGDHIARALIEGTYSEGDTVTVDVAGDTITLR